MPSAKPEPFTGTPNPGTNRERRFGSGGENVARINAGVRVGTKQETLSMETIIVETPALPEMTSGQNVQTSAHEFFDTTNARCLSSIIIHGRDFECPKL